MQQFVIDLIWTYRYMALFSLIATGIIGLPIPVETLLTFVGSLTAFHHLSFIASVAASFAGCMTGMWISYWIGSRVGKPFLDRFGKWFHLTPVRLARAEAWFKKHGVWAVCFGYFVPGIRHLTCYLAGVSRMRFWHYTGYSAIGALVWSFTFVTLGKIIGNNWGAVMDLVHLYLGRGVAVAVAVVLLGILLFMRLRKKRLVK